MKISNEFTIPFAVTKDSNLHCRPRKGGTREIAFRKLARPQPRIACSRRSSLLPTPATPKRSPGPSKAWIKVNASIFLRQRIRRKISIKSLAYAN